uniref:Uncharacterized protein n=1 Tax=Arundo donax TaxID=35708 RepID=A0A0A9D6M4_ARUDO
MNAHFTLIMSCMSSVDTETTMLLFALMIIVVRNHTGTFCYTYICFHYFVFVCFTFHAYSTLFHSQFVCWELYFTGGLFNINGRISFLICRQGICAYSLQWIRRKQLMTLNQDQLLLVPWTDLVL